MSRNPGEKYRIRSSSYAPPQPSCRRPLSRMLTDKSPSSPVARPSLSPKSDGNTSRERSISDKPEISDDEEYRVEDESDEDTERLNALPTKSQESPRQRFSPSYGPTKRKLDASIKKSHRKSSNDYDSDFNEKAEKPLKCSKKKSTPLVKYLFPIIIIVSFVLVGLWYYDPVENPPQLVQNLSGPSLQIRDFRNKIKEIRNKFPGQNRRIWGPIEAGVIDIINGSVKPWTFLLFSNQTKELSCLAKMLGKASSEAVLSEDSLELRPKDFGDNYGRAIDQLRPKIIAKKAVVVHDLMNIDPKAIQAFHTMCDRENPLVEGVIYILTITTAGNIPEFGASVKFVENQLTNRFINKVPEEKLQPLITRLTDGPITPVNPEISLSGC